MDYAVTTFLESLDLVPASREHHDWIESTFARSVSETEEHPEQMRPALKRVIRRVVIDPMAVAMVAIPRGYPDCFLGWAVGYNGALVFDYVKYRYRRQGLGTVLVANVVLQQEIPIRVAYWTRAASRMALGGYPIVHDIGAQSELARYAR